MLIFSELSLIFHPSTFVFPLNKYLEWVAASLGNFIKSKGQFLFTTADCFGFKRKINRKKEFAEADGCSIASVRDFIYPFSNGRAAPTVKIISSCVHTVNEDLLKLEEKSIEQLLKGKSLRTRSSLVCSDAGRSQAGTRLSSPT